MKKTKRIIAAILTLAILTSLFLTVAIAGGYKSGTNVVATVKTGKAPWYCFFLKPQVKVTNTGSSTMTINVEDSNGRLVKTISSLKPGKSTTISLSSNSTYTIYWCGNSWSGTYKATGTIEAVRYIKSIA